MTSITTGAPTALAEKPMPAGIDVPADYEALHRLVQQRLASDSGLASLIASAGGLFTHHLITLTITDTNGLILVHTRRGLKSRQYVIGRRQRYSKPDAGRYRCGSLK